MNKTKIFLADDHAILREGLRHILGTVPGYEVVGESGDGREALGMIEKLKPDIAIIDISMPGMTGIEISRQIKKYVPETRVIILSRHDNEEYVSELLRLGVNGYVLKDNAGDDLLRAVSRGKQLPPARLPALPPPAPDTAETRRLMDVIKASVQLICHAQRVWPNAVVDAAQLEELLRLLAGGQDVSSHGLMQGWRRECLGQALLDLLQGESRLTLQVTDGRMRAEFAPGA